MSFWSSIKTAVKKVWRAVKAVVPLVVRAVVGLIMRVIHIVASLVDLLHSFEKTMTIQVFILRDARNQGVIAEADIEPTLAKTKKIFKDKFNVAIKAYGKPMVQTLSWPAPVAALDVDCDAAAYSHEFGGAGEYFADHLAGWVGIPISLAFPVTVYVVRTSRHCTCW